MSKQKLPRPLEIDCSGLSKKRIAELADRLKRYFRVVTVWDSDITASQPLNNEMYQVAWRILDRYDRTEYPHRISHTADILPDLLRSQASRNEGIRQQPPSELPFPVQSQAPWTARADQYNP